MLKLDSVKLYFNKNSKNEPDQKFIVSDNHKYLALKTDFTLA